MGTMHSVIAATVAGALALSLPMSAANAAYRPGSAVPAAGAVGVAGAPSARLEARRSFAPWPFYVVLAVIAAGGIWIVTDKDNGNFSISRG